MYCFQVVLRCDLCTKANDLVVLAIAFGGRISAKIFHRQTATVRGIRLGSTCLKARVHLQGGDGAGKMFALRMEVLETTQMTS